jgi:hypothetical protein
MEYFHPHEHLWRSKKQQGHDPTVQLRQDKPEELINTVKTCDFKTLAHPRHGKMKVKSPLGQII